MSSKLHEHVAWDCDRQRPTKINHSHEWSGHHGHATVRGIIVAVSQDVVSPRISREQLFMGLADLYSKRGSCARRQVGAVAIRDGRVVAAGYNGAPAGLPDCLSVGCEISAGHCIRAAHAEANLISWAARTGTELYGLTVYCTAQPCLPCSRLLVNAGIQTIIFRDPYEGPGMELTGDLGIEIKRYVSDGNYEI